MHDDMLIIAMNRLFIIHEVRHNHVIMKVIVTTREGGSEGFVSDATKFTFFLYLPKVKCVKNMKLGKIVPQQMKI